MGYCKLNLIVITYICCKHWQLVMIDLNNRIWNQADNKFISPMGEFLLRGACVLFTVVVFFGCKNVDKKSPLKVFHYNEDVSVITLDPAFVKSQSEMWIVSQIFNGLVDLNAQLQTIPGLAKSWEVQNGGRKYIFHLRRDATFCFVGNGGKVWYRNMIAKDVAFSLTRIADPDNASPGAWIFADKIDTTLSQVFVAENDSTFVLNLIKPAASMLNLLATNYGYIVPVEISKIDKAVFSRNPVGTGPFYMRRWEEDVKMVLRKNLNYFEKDSKGRSLPYLDAVNVSFVKNKQTAFMQFIAGSYDFFNGLEGSFKDELLTDSAILKPKYAKKLKAIITPFLNTEYIGCYLGDGFDVSKNKEKNQASGFTYLKDVHFRRALDLSVDKQKLVKFFRNGLGEVADRGFVPPVLLNGVNTKIQPNNFAKNWALAIKEFEASSYGKLFRKHPEQLPELRLSVTADYLDMAVFLQEAWVRLGVKIKVDIQTAGMLRQLRNEGKLQLFRGSWIADYPDAENYLACFYSPFHSPNGPNYTHFSQSKFDDLYKIVEEKTGVDRQVAAIKANQIIQDESPVITLYYDKSIRLMHPWVSGLDNDPSNRLILKRVRLIK